MINSAMDKEVDIVLISEQYARIVGSAWYQDVLGKTSVYVRNPLMTIDKVEEDNENFIVVHTNGIRIYSCYFSPCMEITDFLVRIDRLEQHVKGSNTPVLIGGDFNGKSQEWLSGITDRRGIAVSEMIASLGLIVLNRGSCPTFRRGDSSSIIDITFASPAIAINTIKWEVLEDETLSDHHYIQMEIDLSHTVIAANPTRSKWNTRRINKGKCLEKLTDIKSRTHTSDDMDVDTKAGRLIDILTEICNAGMKRATTFGKNRRQAYWWNQEIAQLRRECHGAKRVATRGKGDQVAMDIYRRARRNLRIAIKDSKRKAWESLCEEVDKDPWGLPYRIVMKKIGNRMRIPGISNPNWAYTIVSTLFPPGGGRGNLHSMQCARECDLFTREEVIEVCHTLKRGKAPGPDGIPNEIISLVCENWPDLFKETFDICLRTGIFPRIWKRQYLVLLRKGEKPLENPSSYRPICLLDTCGKFLEKLITKRLEMEIEGNGGFSGMQFGFVRGRSTIDAILEVVSTAASSMGRMRFCSIVTLDIRNAFNSADWSVICQTMRERGFSGYLINMVDNYLQDRVLEYETENGIDHYEVSAGVPQGSILGPLLWNLMYDGLLNLNLPDGSKLVGYADDVALLVDQPTTPLIEIVTNDCLGRINTWLRSKNLELAASKTEAILVTKRRSFVCPKLKVDGYEINIGGNLKYLGVILDSKLSFEPHIRMVSEKALTTASKLARIMPNIKGPGQATRRLISTVAYSQVLYAAPVISETVSGSRKLRYLLERVHRTCALRIISAYRTISTDAASVLAGVPPIELILQERKEIYNARASGNSERTLIKRNAREKLLQTWQRQWDETERGRWTHELIPNIELWQKRKHGELNFYLTQVFSGHGNFGSYLRRFQRRQSAICEMCNEYDDDVEHTITKCSFWNSRRNTLPDDLRNMTIEQLMELMLTRVEKWYIYSNFIQEILREKTDIQRHVQVPNP